jgi:hypothetical protein
LSAYALEMTVRLDREPGGKRGGAALAGNPV